MCDGHMTHVPRASHCPQTSGRAPQHSRTYRHTLVPPPPPRAKSCRSLGTPALNRQSYITGISRVPSIPWPGPLHKCLLRGVLLVTGWKVITMFGNGMVEGHKSITQLMLSIPSSIPAHLISLHKAPTADRFSEHPSCYPAVSGGTIEVATSRTTYNVSCYVGTLARAHARTHTRTRTRAHTHTHTHTHTADTPVVPKTESSPSKHAQPDG